ncbi:MAG TPA: PAS domain S-box protein [Dehalococcoidia bacterium]|nr:PAS domain S-box protein [Dehalococcoidia bacterium]
MGHDARGIAGHGAGASPITFRTLVEQSLSLILVVDRIGKIEYVNPHFCAATGFDESELAGRLIQELGDVDSATRVDMDAKLSAGRPWRGAIETKKKNGETVTIFAEVSPVSDDAGNVTHFVSVGQDITAVREATRGLRASEEKFRRLAEALPALTFIIQGGKFRFVSSRAEEISGHTVDELMTMDFWEAVHVDFQELVRGRGLARQRGEEVPGRYELKFVTKSGEERWGLVAVSPIEFEGAPAAVGCMFDITEAKATADALHEREEQLRLMTEQMPSVVWMTDRNLTVTYAAGAGLSRLGIDVREYLGMTLPPRYPLDSTNTTLFDAHMAALNGASTSFEFNFLGIWFESRIEPLRSPKGEIIGCLGMSFDITGRKQAEEALSESEQKFRTLVDTMPAAAFIFQGTGYRYANRMCYDVLGYSEEDLPNLNFWDVVHPDYRDLVRERGDARLRGEDVPSTYELLFLKKSGEVRWGLFSAAVITYEGSPAVLGVVYDITDRKVAEQAVIESEEKFRALVDTMPAAAFIYQGTEIKYVNRTFFDFLGYTPEDFPSVTWWDVVHPDYRELVRERSVARQRGEPVPASYEVRFLRQNGEARWGLFAGAVITYEGDPAIMGILYDITERKLAEEALGRSEERYRILYHDNPSMYFTLSADLVILSANEHGSGQLGYSAAELAGQPLAVVVHPDDQASVRRQLTSLVKRRGVEHDIEFRKVRKDGGVIWVQESVGVAQDIDGKDILLVVCQDVTERRRIEEELQILREDLEHKAERTLVSRESPYNLSWRELTVLDLVTGGRSDKEIAVVLGIRPQTVSKHVANVLKKMSASSRTEAGVRALREGLIK